MWEGGKLGCSQNYIFLPASIFSAKCLKVFYLKDRCHHFLVKDRETRALGACMTCLSSLSNPLQELRLQLPSPHAQASALPSSNTAALHQTPEVGCVRE